MKIWEKEFVFINKCVVLIFFLNFINWFWLFVCDGGWVVILFIDFYIRRNVDINCMVREKVLVLMIK